MASMVGEGSSATIGSLEPIIGRLKIFSSSSSWQRSASGRVDYVSSERVVAP